MARYAHLYCEATTALEKATRELNRISIEKENYRTFIQESDLTKSYLMWWAERQGFGEDTLASLRAAFDAGNIADTAKKT